MKQKTRSSQLWFRRDGLSEPVLELGIVTLLWKSSAPHKPKGATPEFPLPTLVFNNQFSPKIQLKIASPNTELPKQSPILSPHHLISLTKILYKLAGNNFKQLPQENKVSSLSFFHPEPSLHYFIALIIEPLTKPPTGNSCFYHHY